MAKQTVNDAIKEAFKREGNPLTIAEIYKKIKQDNLYQFNSANPENIIRTQLRRHCENLHYSKTSNVKHFVFTKEGKYWIKE